jgi:DNA-binding MarR family transcriptional regulator
MTSSTQFTQSLRDWLELFMQRSFHNTMRFAKEEGLSMGQMGALMRLHLDHNCGVSDIGAQLGVTSAAASQMIDRMAQMGLLERTEDPNDRRVKLLTLTDKGRSLLLKARQLRSQWIQDLGKRLDPERQAAVTAALGYLIEAARETEAEE